MNRRLDTPLDDVEERISAQLHAAAGSIAAEGAPQKAVARAEQRERRRVARNGAAAVLVLGASTYGMMRLGSSGSTDLVATAAETPTTQLAWSVGDAEVIQPLSQFVGADGAHYALSTAPGVRATYDAQGIPDPIEQAIYRSVDGRDWELLSRGHDDLLSLVEHKGLLYTVSTAPLPDGTEVNELRSSSDGGQTWSPTEFKVDTPAPADPNGLLVGDPSSMLSVSATDDVVIVVAETWYWPDTEAVTRFLGLDTPGLSLETSADGITLNDWTACDAASAALMENAVDVVVAADEMPVECTNIPVVAEATFAELGLAGGLYENAAWRSVDGGVNWESIDAPGPVMSAGIGGFVAYDTDAVDVADGGGVYRSTDGVVWEAIDTGLGGYLSIAGDVDGRLVAQSYQHDRQVLVSSGDAGETWSTVDLEALLPDLGVDPWIMSIGTGELGAVAVVTSSVDVDTVDYRVLFSADGVDWTVQDLSTAGAPTGGYPSWVFVGDDHVGVVFEGVAAEPDGSVSGVTLLGTPTR